MNMHSGFYLSQADGRPMYQQIMEQIKLRIALGDWTVGTKLPSIRELAIAAGVSVITVKRAYLELEREQFIVTQQGKGSFVASVASQKTDEQHAEMRSLLEKAAKLALLQNLSKNDYLALVQQIYESLLGETPT